jgi:polysaccharide export outer membrane protein
MPPVGLILTLCLMGCGGQVRMPTQEELAAFEVAGSITPAVDMSRIEKAKLKTGPYRVVPGDVLEFTMPALLQAVTAAEVQMAQARSQAEYPYLCRVRDDGTITLPAIGPMAVADLSLAQIEERVTDAYRNYVVLQPSVFVRVAEYRTSKVYITGAVQEPGVYLLQADQMTLSYLLTQAGGISEAGAAVVRVVRSEHRKSEATDGSTSRDDKEQPILLPVINTNIPYRDISLDEGDTVVVEPVQMPIFSIVGLVNTPGNIPYPPTAEYNLMQAIAYGGGLDRVADPHYVTIYRLREDGSIARIPFHLIKDGELTEALATPIRPGDVVAVEHTLRTRMNTMIRDLVRINAGFYVTGRDLWDRE